jgi:hypothetical protein
MSRRPRRRLSRDVPPLRRTAIVGTPGHSDGDVGEDDDELRECTAAMVTLEGTARRARIALTLGDTLPRATLELTPAEASQLAAQLHAIAHAAAEHTG